MCNCLLVLCSSLVHPILNASFAQTSHQSKPHSRQVSNLHCNEKPLWQCISRPHIRSEISPSRFWKSPPFLHCRKNCNGCQQNFPAIIGASGHEMISFTFFTQFLVSKGSFWPQQAHFEQILTAEQKNHVIKLKQRLQHHHHHTYM